LPDPQPVPVPSAIRELGKRLQKPAEGFQQILGRREGIVTSIDLSNPSAGLPTLTVNMGGIDIPGMAYVASYVPTVGDKVFVEMAAKDPLVVGKRSDGTDPVTDLQASVTALQLSSGKLMGYAEDPNLRSGVTTTFDVPGCEIVFDAIAGRYYRLSGHVNISSAVATPGFLGIFTEGGTEIGRFGQDNLWGAAGDVTVFEGSKTRTFSAGSHTVKLTVQRTAGSGDFDINGDDDPSWILIEDIGPSP
jgi:hypothetical protein